MGFIRLASSLVTSNRALSLRPCVLVIISYLAGRLFDKSQRALRAMDYLTITYTCIIIVYNLYNVITYIYTGSSYHKSLTAIQAWAIFHAKSEICSSSVKCGIHYTIMLQKQPDIRRNPCYHL